jgi:hypothetical protein
MNLPSDLGAQIASVERDLSAVKTKEAALTKLLATLRAKRTDVPQFQELPGPPKLVRCELTTSEKVHIFAGLFRGREDVYALRFESRRTGRSGYQPACKNEWIKGVCGKPRIKCSRCANKELLALDEQVIKNHLLGHVEGARIEREVVVGIYPLCHDETCWFLAADFDKESWVEDSKAFCETCTDSGVPVSLERSRSGKGAHAWIFFAEPVPAANARKMGSFLLTEAMEKHAGLDFNSYDRLFPNQDTIPKEGAGYGNLIALPFQRRAVEKGNTLFLNNDMCPHVDQWDYLIHVRRIRFRRGCSCNRRLLLPSRQISRQNAAFVLVELRVRYSHRGGG